MLYELRLIEEQLVQLGILETGTLLIPGENEVWDQEDSVMGGSLFNLTVNREPIFLVLVTLISPPCRSRIIRTTDRPSPEPGICWEREGAAR